MHNEADDLRNKPSFIKFRLSDVPLEEVFWLRPDIWPQGKLSLVVGDPGFGKSFLTLDAAARISRGADWPEGTACPSGNVVLFSAEDDLSDTIAPRLAAQNADLDKIFAVTGVRQKEKERVVSLESDLALLEDTIQEKSPQAVFFDPLTAYLGGVDSYVDSEIRGLLSPLSILANKHKTSIIAVMHLNKSQSKVLYKVSGSIGFVGAARSVFAVIPDPEAEDAAAPGTRRFFLPVKINLCSKRPGLAFRVEGNASTARLVWEEGSFPVPNIESVVNGEGTCSGGTITDAKSFLEEILSAGEVAGKEVYRQAREAGISERTLERAKASLKVRAVKVGDVWMWRPQDGGQVRQQQTWRPLANLNETRVNTERNGSPPNIASVSGTRNENDGFFDDSGKEHFDPLKGVI